MSFFFSFSFFVIFLERECKIKKEVWGEFLGEKMKQNNTFLENFLERESKSIDFNNPSCVLSFYRRKTWTHFSQSEWVFYSFPSIWLVLSSSIVLPYVHFHLFPFSLSLPLDYPWSRVYYLTIFLSICCKRF